MLDFGTFTKNCLRMWEILGKLIVAEGFKKVHKVQNIAQSGHTLSNLCLPEGLSYTNTAAYHLGWFGPLTASTKELHEYKKLTFYFDDLGLNPA